MLKHLTLGWSRLFTAIVLFVIIFGYSDTSAQKRVILEQFTGAWCGWCVDGSYVMDNIIAKYPDNFIGVKWHNGDGMQIVGYDTAASICMISGFPMGSVCRAGVNVNGQVTRGLSRGAWEQVTDQIVKATNVVDIEAFSSINTSTREISVIVNATFNTFLQGEARLNVYLCQDDVTGSGGAYDQHNYLSGRAGYENNPYYKLPGTITGYHHMKVVRFVLGGVFGAPNTITSTQAGAKNTATFKYTIPATATNASDKSSVIDLSKLFVVATVNTYTSNWSNLEILNCCYATKGTPSSEVTMTDPPQGVKP
ncbi:MAG: Omp28-related outer membrane protein, partial [Bacteroidota bacterium]